MRKIIIYWGHFELPDQNSLSHRVRANCYALSKSRFKPILVGYNRNHSNMSILDTKEIDEEFEYYYIKYPKTFFGWFKDCFSYKKIKQIIDFYGHKSVHSVIITSVGCINTIGIMRICRKYHIHLVSDVVDWFEKYSGNIVKRLLKTLDDKIMMSIIRPKIRHIICISSYLQNYFNQRNCNTIIVPSLTYKEDKRFKNLSTYKADHKILYTYVGSPGFKGLKDRIDWCVRVFYELFNNSDREMHIYGMSKDDFLIQFKDMQYIINNSTNIFFHGKRENKVCLEAIRKTDFFIFAREDNLTSKAGFPTKLSESFACGTPVITTPAGDIINYVHNSINGFISKSCTYESFKETMKCTEGIVREDVIRMHRNCQENNPLDASEWIDKINDYFNSL